ncbi:MAG: hypothetical protein O3C40_07925 [Planctomycetota bacterium]|nr:hypothetical protein [Planctomycetota bacterium]
MKNPWHDLPDTAPYVLPCDRAVVDAYNTARVGTPDAVLQTHLLPEPFFGRAKANVCVLGLNPGYSPPDDKWYTDAAFTDAIRKNLTHAKLEYPHYFLDPRFEESPGAGWWRRKCKWLINDCGLEAVSQNLFCVELFPYHSRRFKPIPKSVSPDGWFKSSAYTAHLVREAMNRGKAIVAMRSFKRWCCLIPELPDYSNLYRLNSPQNVSLSPNNITGYDELVAQLRRTSRI